MVALADPDIRLVQALGEGGWGKFAVGIRELRENGLDGVEFRAERIEEQRKLVRLPVLVRGYLGEQAEEIREGLEGIGRLQCGRLYNGHAGAVEADMCVEDVVGEGFERIHGMISGPGAGSEQM